MKTLHIKDWDGKLMLPFELELILDFKGIGQDYYDVYYKDHCIGQAIYNYIELLVDFY